MSSKPLMLEGLAEPPEADDGLLRKLRKEKQQLEDDLRDVRQELDDARTQNERLERSMRNLRTQLSPLHRGLRALFGEIELAVGEEQYSAPSVTTAAPSNSGTDPRWESFKQTFPGIRARIIDALLVHGEMNIAQLSGFLKAAYSTVKDALPALYKAGALTKESGKGGAVRLNR